MSFFTYILFSQKLDRYYVGSIKNIENRLQQHNSGRTPSTKGGRPWIMVYFEEFETRQEAIHREMEIKKKKSKKYIEYLISSVG